VSVFLAAFVLVIEVIGASIAGRHQADIRRLDALGFWLLVVGALAMVVRQRWRVPAYAVTLAATVAYAVLGYPYGPVFLAVLVSIFGAVRTGHRHAVWIATGLAYLTFVLFGHLVSSVDGIATRAPGLGGAIGVAAWTLVTLAMAEGVRVRTERFEQIARTHAEQARARAEQERRQTSEERLQIARELHDVIGHHLSLINVRAGVGLHLMSEQPDQARVALEAIKQASAEALGEVRAVLGALRPKDEAAPRAPAPSLDNLDSLADPAATAIVGEPVALPPEVDRAAYRIVQESLTNVRRHAGDGAAARVTISYQPEQLEIRVEDDGSGASPATANPPPGDGIAGMRARAVALGGALEAGRRRGGGFRVVATLPIRGGEIE
jgi:signal transduction histidine kinase